MKSTILTKEFIEEQIMRFNDIRELEIALDKAGEDLFRAETHYWITEKNLRSKRVSVKPVEKEYKPTKVIRHSRYYDPYTDEVLNKGGMTYAFKIHHNLGVVEVGVSICSRKDYFSRKVGREIACKRLSETPIKFSYDANSDMGLIDQFWDAYNHSELSGHRSMIYLIDNFDTEDLYQ